MLYFQLSEKFRPIPSRHYFNFEILVIVLKQFSDSSCPSSYKYAYLDGDYCCRTNKEKIGSGKEDDLCDGSEIGIDSRCCENNDYAKCEYERCINHKDAITTDQGNFN